MSDVFDYLSQHLEFIPYISIFVVTNNSPKEQETSEISTLESTNKLSNFYDTVLIPSEPSMERKITPDFSALTGYHRRIYHTLVFAEKEMNTIKHDKYEENVGFLKHLIDFISEVRKDFQEIRVCIDEDKLFGDLKKDPVNASRLASYHKFRYSLISRLSNTLTTYEENISELKRMIEIMSLSVDPQTSFFPQHPLQTSFERVLMSPLLPYCKDISELIDEYETTDPQMFVDMIFEEVVTILKDLQFTEKRHDMALVLLLYRYIFDRVYKENSILNSETQTQNLIDNLRLCPVERLSLPKEYCPPYDESQPAMTLFRKDEHFSKAVEALEEVQWHVNPFDILHCVEETIQQIEISASAYSTEETKCSVFPFEVTFSLFMGVLLSSQIMNWSNIIDFVVKYTPQTGLAPKFEYARAKMEASQEELKSLFFSKQNNHVETEIETAGLQMRSINQPSVFAC